MNRIKLSKIKRTAALGTGVALIVAGTSVGLGAYVTQAVHTTLTDHEGASLYVGALVGLFLVVSLLQPRRRNR